MHACRLECCALHEKDRKCLSNIFQSREEPFNNNICCVQKEVLSDGGAANGNLTPSTLAVHEDQDNFRHNGILQDRDTIVSGDNADDAIAPLNANVKQSVLQDPFFTSSNYQHSAEQSKGHPVKVQDSGQTLPLSEREQLQKKAQLLLRSSSSTPMAWNLLHTQAKLCTAGAMARTSNQSVQHWDADKSQQTKRVRS